MSCFLCVFLYAQTNVSGNISGTWTTYPNPVQDILNVKGFDGQGYEIVNIQGQKLLEGFLSKDGISVKDLPAGMYLIQIIGNFNEQILSTKFFKP
jgi:hypothetical protein